MTDRPSSNSSNSSGAALILEWGKGPILTHIAGALQELGYHVVTVRRTGENLPELLKAVEEHHPSLCVTRQRLYPNMDGVSQRLAEQQCGKLIVDLGIWPHYGTYFMDTSGENATSTVVGNLARLEADPLIRSEVNGYGQEIDQMRSTIEERAELATEQTEALGLDLSDDFSLVILQREGDQVLIYDSPEAWRDPCAVAREAVAEAERTNRFVVVKAHPQSSLKDLGIPPEGPNHRVAPAFKNGKANDQQLAWLMIHARNAIMVNSTCHFQTLSLGIPTICLEAVS